MTGPSAKTAPTDRSNSPAVSSSVMASAMMPSSGRKAIMLEMLSGDRKFGLASENATSTMNRMTSEANCGDAVSPRHLTPRSFNLSVTALIANPEEGPQGAGGRDHHLL